MASCRAGSGDVHVFALQAELDRDVCGCHVRDDQRDIERIGLRAALKLLDLHLMLLHGADTAADDHAQTERIFTGKIEAGILKRFPRRSDSILREKLHSLGGFEIHEIPGIKAFDLAGELDGGIGNIHFRNRGDPVSAFFQALPERGHIIAQRGDSAQTCDYDSSCFHISILLIFVSSKSVIKSEGNRNGQDHRSIRF